jgi:alkaline phosphatase D
VDGPWRVVQLSDTHLSRRRAYAATNFERVVDWLAADPPALVVNTGDLALDDPDDADDRAFAAQLHRRIDAPLVVIPGNHDIGDSGPEPWQGERVDAERLARFVDVWGADRFCVDVGDWRLVGLNDVVVGELPEVEAEQEEWFIAATRGAERVAVFVHKPLCVERLDLAGPAGWAVEPAARSRFVELLGRAPVRLVASGHLHVGRSGILDGWTTVWAPSTAFIPTNGRPETDRCGVVEYVFDGPSVRWSFIEPPGIAHPSGEHYRQGAASLRWAPEQPYAGTT